MVLEQLPERVKCRRCSAKLPKPTANDREAFCCKGCFRIFYSKVCFICEEPADKLLCRKAKCRSGFDGLKRHGVLGRYYPPTNVSGASGNSIKIGVPIIGPGDVPINILGGYRWPGAKIDQLPVSLRKMITWTSSE